MATAVLQQNGYCSSTTKWLLQFYNKMATAVLQQNGYCSSTTKCRLKNSLKKMPTVWM
jgi:hypothetical protein